MAYHTHVPNSVSDADPIATFSLVLTMQSDKIRGKLTSLLLTERLCAEHYHQPANRATRPCAVAYEWKLVFAPVFFPRNTPYTESNTVNEAINCFCCCCCAFLFGPVVEKSSLIGSLSTVSPAESELLLKWKEAGHTAPAAVETIHNTACNTKTVPEIQIRPANRKMVIIR